MSSNLNDREPVKGVNTSRMCRYKQRNIRRRRCAQHRTSRRQSGRVAPHSAPECSDLADSTHTRSAVSSASVTRRLFERRHEFRPPLQVRGDESLDPTILADDCSTSPRPPRRSHRVRAGLLPLHRQGHDGHPWGSVRRRLEQLGWNSRAAHETCRHSTSWYRIPARPAATRPAQPSRIR